ncbi:MAG: grasp-with-spasm system SPASM domain peptide maturase [Bacteroidales bacterium]|nr:grasp-with-spasm system SPASM domain peptide maturase [Bacteroidales bacterium]
MRDRFKLFSCCIPVKGYLRSTLYDLQRKNYLFIPNSLFDILTNHTGKTFDEVLQLVDDDEREQVEKYLTYLLGKEFIFLCAKEDLECFPPLTPSWESSAEIDSVIIDINENSNYNYAIIANDISRLRSKVIQLRIFSIKGKQEIAGMINVFSKTDTKSLEVIFPNKEGVSVEFIKEIIDKNSRVTSLFIIDSPNKELSDYKQATVRYTADKITSESSCGIISKAYFDCHLNTYCESQNFNTCLNKKIAIDVNGIIKNCPSCAQSFGNIRNTPIRVAMEHPDFKKLWGISKDQIDVCKDCEFRHMCTDCRAYIKDPENIYSQPAKCTYNPYIAKWEDEEGYVSVEECGTYSREKGFIVDDKKVEALNMALWGA